MKQHITIEQWNELTVEQYKRFCDWQISHEWSLDGKPDIIPNIGQLIEFLDENIPKDKYGFDSWMDKIFHYTTDDDGIHRSYKGEFCDALWESVKEVLASSQRE